MIKFETINGTLCRMVEPTPLQLDSEFPCVVRLIQDDSPMGRYNLKLRNIALEPLVVTGIAKDIGVVMHLVPRPHFSCECYEIIGYPVADGSAEWALYHVLHKERRALTGYVNDVLVHIQNTEYGIGLYYSGKIMPFDFITPEQFIEGAAHTGWQLYEPQPKPKPKPLLADAQVGWLCKLRNGEWRQIKGFGDSWGTNDCLNPNLFTVFLTDGTTRNIYGTYLGTTANPLPNDIIATEPIASEGSAEWAWQMLKLGKPVTNKRVFTAGGYIKATCSDKYNFVKMWGYSGWQLYEPKPEPEPAFKVGDWVTDGVVDGYIAELDNGIAQVKKYGISYSANVEHLRKLSPSEVVLDFGNGIKGRIRNVDDGWIRIRDNESLNNIATIDTAKLTEPMQTTVRKLLAAIEEERKKQ